GGAEAAGVRTARVRAARAELRAWVLAVSEALEASSSTQDHTTAPPCGRPTARRARPAARAAIPMASAIAFESTDRTRADANGAVSTACRATRERVRKHLRKRATCA